MNIKRSLSIIFASHALFWGQVSADTVTKGLEQTARDVGNGVVGLLNAFGSGKLKPDNIELLSDSKVALSFNGQRFNNPCGIEIFWGDGSSEKFRVEKDAYKTGFTLEHQYETPQDYQIEINGKVIFRGLKTVVNCPGNYEGTIALANQTPSSSTQPPQDQTTQTLSAQSEETLANAEKIRALEAEVAKKQAERIAELEAQLEAQANDEKIKKLEKELAEKQAKRIAELEAQLMAKESRKEENAAIEKLTKEQAERIKEIEAKLAETDSKPKQTITSDKPETVSATYETKQTSFGRQLNEWKRGNWALVLECQHGNGDRVHYKGTWSHNGKIKSSQFYTHTGYCHTLDDFYMQVHRDISIGNVLLSEQTLTRASTNMRQTRSRSVAAERRTMFGCGGRQSKIA